MVPPPWSLHYGPSTMVPPLWLIYYGPSAMVPVLWSLCCDLSTKDPVVWFYMVPPLWSQCYGPSTMVLLLWSLCNGPSTMVLPLGPSTLVLVLWSLPLLHTEQDWLFHLTPFQMLNLNQSQYRKLGLIIIKLPQAPLHHVPRCYGPLLITKLTLTSQ